MDKTLHKKLTAKQPSTTAPAIPSEEHSGIFGVLRDEKRILDALAKDLLQPRPEAIANIMEMARKM